MLKLIVVMTTSHLCGCTDVDIIISQCLFSHFGVGIPTWKIRKAGISKSFQKKQKN